MSLSQWSKTTITYTLEVTVSILNKITHISNFVSEETVRKKSHGGTSKAINCTI